MHYCLLHSSGGNRFGCIPIFLSCRWTLVLVCEGGEDAGAGAAVAVGVDGVGHAAVGFRVVEEGGHFADDTAVVGADEAHCACREGFGALGGVAHHEHGLAQPGGFFLDASAVGEDKGGLLHEADERQVFERFDEVHVAEAGKVVAEHFVDGTPHVGVEVHGVDEVDFGVPLGEAFDGAAHGEEAVAEVFAAVSGDEHEAAAVAKAVEVVAGGAELVGKGCGESGVVFDFVDDPVEGVDDGVAGDGDAGVVDVFAQEVFAAERSGREVVGGDPSGDLAVHFFRPGAVDVVGAQPCFDVAHGDLPIECGEGGGGAGGSVAMHEHYVGARFVEHVAHAREHAGGDVVEVLPLSHDVEVVVGTDVEYFEHLVEHFAMLPGDANDGLESVGGILECFDERRHFDCFGTGAEHEHYPFRLGSCHICRWMFVFS